MVWAREGKMSIRETILVLEVSSVKIKVNVEHRVLQLDLDETVFYGF